MASRGELGAVYQEVSLLALLDLLDRSMGRGLFLLFSGEGRPRYRGSIPRIRADFLVVVALRRRRLLRQLLFPCRRPRRNPREPRGLRRVRLLLYIFILRRRNARPKWNGLLDRLRKETIAWGPGDGLGLGAEFCDPRDDAPLLLIRQYYGI